jgi:tetratricopeptide (TPR) repeat protein
MPNASIFETHQYGRQLINQKMYDKALDVFKMNAKKNKDTWPVHYGLARGYSAKGDYKTALKHLKKALANAPNAASKGRVQANIAKLEKEEDIN